jgi:hypothetical protein
MNADAFMAWFEKRLCPTFEVLYPGKRMVLVLDNASYHRARNEDYVNPKTLRREELAAKLDEFKIHEIAGVRTDKQGVQRARLFPSSTFHAGRGGPNAPTVDEMIARLDLYLADHPELQQTRLDAGLQAFSAKHNQPSGYHYYLLTPPYVATFQSIELCWSHSKRYVASQHVRGRTVKRLRQEIITGFYGNGKDHPPPNCQKLIRHAEKEMQAFIDGDWVVRGTLNSNVPLDDGGLRSSPVLIINLDDDDYDDDDESLNDFNATVQPDPSAVEEARLQAVNQKIAEEKAQLETIATPPTDWKQSD